MSAAERAVAWARCIYRASLLACACEEPRPPDPAPVVWEGEHLEFATNGEVEPICGGTLEFLDAFIGAATDEMGLTPQAPIRYYLLSGRELVELDFCPPGAACVYRRLVYTTKPVNTHEVTHAMRHASLGNSLPAITFFVEGIAELYDLEPMYIDPTRDVYAALDATRDGLRGRMPFEFYGVAGDFTRDLEIEHGIGAVSEFLSAMRQVKSVPEVEAVFSEHFGESMETVVARNQDEYPACSDFARARHVVQCAQEPLVFEDGRIEVAYDMTCEDTNVVGPIGGRMTRSFTFTVNETQLLFFQAPRPESPWELPPCTDFQVEVIDCERGCLSQVDLRGPTEDNVSSLPDEGAEFPPGRYLVRLSRAIDDPGPVCLTVDGEP